MIRILAAILVALSLQSPANAQESAIQGVIGAQLDAFLADDFDTAFTYASPSIKSLFGNSRNFEAMVKNGFPMVWRPAEVEYMDLELRDRGPVQRVLITDENGVRYALDYYMIETEAGWQINGVDILPAPEIGV